jgi:hypothetical protein
VRTISKIVFLLPLLLGASPSRAQTASASEVEALLAAVNAQAARLSSEEQKLEESRRALEEHQKNLLRERAQFNDLKAKVTAATGKTILEPKSLPPQPNAGTKNANLPAQPKGAAPKTAQAQTAAAQVSDGATPPAAASPATATTASGPGEVGVDRKVDEDKPQIAAVIDQGGVLLKKGKMVVTSTSEYTRSSATRVAISGFSIIPALNIGVFEITKTNRDSFTASEGVRYGVTNRFELEAKVPYVYRKDATNTRPIGSSSTTEFLTEVTGNNIGDVEFGAHYQMTDGQDGWPFLIGNVRFKTATGTNPYDIPLNAAGVGTELPTGSGFYALQPSVTAIFPSDPVVFYSNVGYLHNFARSFATTGEISPGDSVNASFGMSLSLNDKASFSVGYGHNTVFEPTINGVKPPTATLLQVGSVDLGFSYNLTDRTNLNFAVSAGITEDAPDARLVFRVPITYDFAK